MFYRLPKTGNCYRINLAITVISCLQRSWLKLVALAFCCGIYPILKMEKGRNPL
jgi:hypothetical protein